MAEPPMDMTALNACMLPRSTTVYPDALLRGIYGATRTIAMVGASPNWNRPSYFVMRYLQRKGFRVIPVNPRALDEPILGETHRQLSDEERLAAGAGPDVIRLSVGIEDVADLIADLEAALATG